MGALPARVNVLWDDWGVQDAPSMTATLREAAAKALSEASAGMVATLINTTLLLRVPIAPSQIRTSCGTCTNDPRPDVPVQIEAMAVISSDKAGLLVANAGTLRLGLASMVLNWFEDNEGVCQGANIEAVRVSLIGLGMEELTCELDPYTRQIVGGSGGDLSQTTFGMTTVPRIY